MKARKMIMMTRRQFEMRKFRACNLKKQLPTKKTTQYFIFTIIRQVGKQLTLFSNVNNQLLIISWYCRWQTEDDYHYRRSLRAPANDWETFKSKWSWQHGETSFKIRLLRKDHSRCLPWLFLGSCRPKTNDSLVYNKSKWQNRSNHGPKVPRTGTMTLISPRCERTMSDVFVQCGRGSKLSRPALPAS